MSPRARNLLLFVSLCSINMQYLWEANLSGFLVQTCKCNNLRSNSISNIAVVFYFTGEISCILVSNTCFCGLHKSGKQCLHLILYVISSFSLQVVCEVAGSCALRQVFCGLEKLLSKDSLEFFVKV